MGDYIDKSSGTGIFTVKNNTYEMFKVTLH